MAATAVYASVTRIPRDSQARDGHAESNISATTSAFTLKGGLYCVDVQGSTFGTATLQRLGPDGTNYVTAMTAFSASGSANADLPQGSYRLALA
jgi:hypothetical protein